MNLKGQVETWKIQSLVGSWTPLVYHLMRNIGCFRGGHFSDQVVALVEKDSPALFSLVGPLIVKRVLLM